MKTKSWTKEKQQAYTKKHYQENKEGYIMRSKKRYQDKKELCLSQSKERYIKNRTLILAQTRQARKAIKLDVMSHYSADKLACVRCGIEDIDVLCLDHIDGGGTKQRHLLGRTSSTSFYYWVKKNNYPEGFQVLCANCNLKKRMTQN